MRPPNSTANDSVGASVALSANGGVLAVGGPGGPGDDEMTPGEVEAFEARTLTAPSCQPGTVGVGQSATCTATVTDYGLGEATPTGTVSFTTDSSGSFGGTAGCTLSEGSTGTSSCQVTYTPSSAGSGSHVLTASYSGDDAHAPGIAQTTVAIDRVTTSTAVSCTPASVVVGQTASCTATITVSDASAGPPTGSVTFATNGPGVFSATGCQLPARSGATASCSSSYVPSAIGPGTHQLTAAYGGDGGHAASQGSNPLGVGEAPTSTSIGCAPPSVTVGKTTTCTITVTDAGSGAQTPTGAVTLKSSGAGSFSNCTLAAHGTGAATCMFTYEPANAAAGAPRLTATYGGDGDHFGSSASALLHVPATGTPAVAPSSATLSRGRIRVSLGCPKTEAYCRVTLTVTVRPGTLAAGRVRIAGGRRTTLALAPKRATLQRLGAGRHAVTVLVVAVDQGRRSKRTSLSGYCVVGAHFKLVMLHVRR